MASEASERKETRFYTKRAKSVKSDGSSSKVNEQVIKGSEKRDTSKSRKGINIKERRKKIQQEISILISIFTSSCL